MVATEIVEAIRDVSHWETMTSFAGGNPPAAEDIEAFKKATESLRDLIVRRIGGSISALSPARGE